MYTESVNAESTCFKDKNSDAKKNKAKILEKSIWILSESYRIIDYLSYYKISEGLWFLLCIAFVSVMITKFYAGKL